LRIYPVILCGGSGVRLWPASRPARPKQFIPLIGELSLFQETVLRLRGLEGGQAPLIMTGQAHVPHVERQLSVLGVTATILVEPEGRDSAPAIAAAAHWIHAQDKDAVAVVAASDHHIPDAEAFRASVALAAKAAARGSIVTFGVKPTGPVTAYGYIERADPIRDVPGVWAVRRFVEKPDAQTAARYVADGLLWNSGNFVFAPAALIEEFEVYAPEVEQAAARAVAAGGTGAFVRLSDEFRAAPKISFDYAVMEKTKRAAVASLDFEWSDMGAWDAVWGASPKDAAGNVAAGALLVDCADTFVRSTDVCVVGLGLKRIAIVAESDAILICDLDHAQGVKTAVEVLKSQGRPEVDVRPRASEKQSVKTPADLRQWLNSAALPIWWALGADHERGGFYEALDHRGAPVIAPRRARVQTRQIYTFAKAAEMGWAGPAKAAVAHGLDYFVCRYRRDDGLFRALVTQDGAPADETARLYDQAFAVLALADGGRALPERTATLLGHADQLLATLKAERRHGLGFSEIGGETPYQSNPHMHLLEAALAVREAGGAAHWDVLADELVELCLTGFICERSGGVLEYFDDQWRPAAGTAGRLLEPGHQFEWAWLLERWGKARGHDGARQTARALFDVGLKGVGAEGVINALLDDGSSYDRNARLWPQTEWLKAAILLSLSEADDAQHALYRSSTARASMALGSFLDDVAVTGLWRDKRNSNGDFVDEPVPASSLYHITCAIAETRSLPPA